MADIATLQIRIQSLEAKVAEERLERLARQSIATQGATSGLMSTFVKFAGPVAALAAGVGSLTKAMAVEREFGVLNAGLITATGSSEKASKAFGALEDFASRTPYSLQQSTQGFTKLVNLGLDPSIRAMTSYGDTAAAMGKDMNDMIEAVADAATGEFERLKEFGIKASSQGDRVSFTFKGMTTTIGKNAAEIEEYLIGLGETNFAGGMARRMEELDGRLSNLGDTWDKTWRIINEKGLGDLMKESVTGAADILAEFNAGLESGEYSKGWEAFVSQFDGINRDLSAQFNAFVEVATSGLDQVTEYMGLASVDWAGFGKEGVDRIVAFWKYLPINIRYFIQRVGVEISTLVEYAKVFGPAVVDHFSLSWDELVKRAEIIFEGIGKIMTFEGFDFKTPLQKIEKEYDQLYTGLWEDAVASAEKVRAARLSEIDAINQVRDADIASYESRLKAANDARKKYDDEKKAAQDALDAGEDPLSEFKIVKPETEERELGFWDRWLEAADRSLTSLDDIAANTIDNFSQGFGNAFESMIFDSQTFGDAFYNLMSGIARSTINALGQMAGQWIAYKMVQMTTGKAAAVGGAAALTAEAQAASMLAGIHAFKSTAAIPIIGPPAAPGAMSAALAVTQPLAAGVATASAGMMAGMAHDGIDYIPREGTWLLDRGERVVDSRTNEDLKGFLQSNKTTNINSATTNNTTNNQLAPPAEQGKERFKIVNVLDPAIVGEYLATDDGEEQIVNIMRKNPDLGR